MVSKAALQEEWSRRMRMVSSPAAIRRSLVILMSAVSVLWSGRNPAGTLHKDNCQIGENGVGRQLSFPGFWR